MTPSKRIIQIFLVGQVHHLYMKIETFRDLIKHIEEKIQSARFHVSKTSSLYHLNFLGVIKDL